MESVWKVAVVAVGPQLLSLQHQQVGPMQPNTYACSENVIGTEIDLSCKACRRDFGIQIPTTNVLSGGF